MALKNGRIVVQYRVKLTNISPIIVGNGEDEPMITEDNEVYIPATTIAGAFRDYISTTSGTNRANEMFGKESLSKVFVYDMFSKFKGYEVRPAIKVDKKTGTVSKNKFDRTFIREGHEFNLKIELYAYSKTVMKKYKNDIEACICAVHMGDITIGAYKTIGSGNLYVKDIYERSFDLNDKKELFKFLEDNEDGFKELDKEKLSQSYEGHTVTFRLEGRLKTPILIEGYESLDCSKADGEQMTDGEGRCIIPGSSIKGAVRAEGERILRYLNKEEYGKYIFGAESESDDKMQSNFTAFDTVINNTKKEPKITYNKIKIDKFTGGTIKSALMDEEPVLGNVVIQAKYRKVRFINEVDEKIISCEGINDSAIGLIALIFRGFAIGELNLGSGSGIGRGRIQGQCLTISDGDRIIFKGNIESGNIEVDKLEKLLKTLNDKKVC